MWSSRPKLKQIALGRRCYRLERAAMNRRRAQLVERLDVLVGAVSLVLREAVAGVKGVELYHHAVARDFGNDRRGRDAETFAIATDDFGLRKFEAWDEAAVHQHVAGRQTQGRQRAAARRHGGPIDIEAIDFVDLGDADADCYRALADGREEFLALLMRQLF